MVTLALSAVAGALVARAVPIALLILGLVAGAIAAFQARRGGVAVLAAAFLTTSALAAHARAGLDDVRRGTVTGWITVRSDPQRYGAGVSAEVVLEGRHYVARAYGGRARRLESHLAGERVLVTGEISALSPVQRARWEVRHVVGNLSIETEYDRDPGSGLARASNRVRGLLTSGAGSLPLVERSLFLGLVMGDDRAQPPEVVATMRAAGLSHLSAVSGQNVAFVLVMLGPLLRRLRPRPRWVATVLVVLWFGAITRWEPSVLRASAMAVLGATTFWRGWTASSVRLVGLGVTGLLLLDPFLVRSVGWWMSVGATLGLALFARPLERRLPGPSWLTGPLSVSLAAHAGVAPVTAMVFGTAPALGPLTNLLAVPVAGLVMVWGIPAGLLAGVVPVAGPLVHLPSLAATRWIAAVAQLGARLEPGWPPAVTLSLQAGTLAAVLAWGRSAATAEPTR